MKWISRTRHPLPRALVLATLLSAGFGWLSPESPAHLNSAAFLNHQSPKRQILLVPIDSRPAAGQFAQMIGAIGGFDIKTPPVEFLGRFTTPGNPDAIMDWLLKQDLQNVDAVIASADMLAYGGLVASREYGCTASLAADRLRRLNALRLKAPAGMKILVFATTMRLAPTATLKNAPWRNQLSKYEELKDYYERTGDESIVERIEGLQAKVPKNEILDYERTRRRNHNVQIQLLQQTIGTSIDFLLMGQDDAKPDGPHIQENANLVRLVNNYRLDKKVQFCEGIDQHSNILVSRVILEKLQVSPRVRVVYSDPSGPEQFALYESKPVRLSLQDQIVASGATLVPNDAPHDYTLYVNTPKRRLPYLQNFLQALRNDLELGHPVAVADINFGPDGASDELVYNEIATERRSQNLIAYAGWNTAGNTMGTSIPSANVYLAAKTVGPDSVERELAQKEFLLHRLVDDWAYHKFTRPNTYRLIDSLQRQREEVYGINFRTVNAFVQKELTRHAEAIFSNQIQGIPITAGGKVFQIEGLEWKHIGLPWPRAYEAQIEFKLKVSEVDTSARTIRNRPTVSNLLKSDK